MEKLFKYELSSEKLSVLKNTYMLLAITLMFSAITAGLALTLNMGGGFYLITMVLSFIALIMLMFKSDSKSALLWVFLFTGLQGFSLGGVIQTFLEVPNGSGIVLQSLLATATTFIAMSVYVLVTKKSFSFLRGILFTSLISILVLSTVNLFLGVALLQTLISFAIVLIMSGYILLETSDIIEGVENNYVRATVGLYLNIVNLFLAFLNIFKN